MASEQQGWDWYWICVAAWATMMGAWMAAADVLGLPGFSLRCGLFLVAAFPVAYYLHFSEVSRERMNTVVFLAAVLLGFVEFSQTWQSMLWSSMENAGAAYRLLISVFLWVTVMRSFALRTTWDMLTTILPAASILLLVLVSQPNVIAVIGTSIALMGACALMAAAHEEKWAEPARRVWATTGRLSKRTRSANSWPTVYLFGLLVALVAAQGFRSVDLTAVVGRELQIRMARVLARYIMLRYRTDYVSGDPMLYINMPAPTSNQPLFEVEADQGLNWRVLAYTRYDGRSWSSDFRRSHISSRVTPTTYKLAIDPLSGKGPRSSRFTARITARVPMGGSIPSVFWPLWVTYSKVERPTHVRVDSLGDLWFSRYVQPGDTYVVVAARPVGGSEPLALPEPMRRACLQLPENLPERVRRLADKLVAGRPSPNAKISAISRYLAAGYKYDDFPEFPGRGRDAVDFFLFESHRGYCVHFASAFVVLCRCVGLPARMATGFVEGDVREGTSVYVVRAKDAHAWAEIFVPGSGWLEFDPTPPRPLTTAEVAAQTWDEVQEALGRGLRAAGLWLVRNMASAVAIAAVLVLLLVARRRRTRYAMLQISRPSMEPRQQIQFAYRQMLLWLEDLEDLDHLAWWGEATTPLEVAQGLGEEWNDARLAAIELAWLYTQSVYSPRVPTPQEAEQAVQAAQRVRDRWLELRRRLG